jgi:hypothetical protein
MQVYGLVGQTEEGIWPKVMTGVCKWGIIYIIYIDMSSSYLNKKCRVFFVLYLSCEIQKAYNRKGVR